MPDYAERILQSKTELIELMSDALHSKCICEVKKLPRAFDLAVTDDW